MAAGQGTSPNLQMYVGFYNSAGNLFAYSPALASLVKSGLQPNNGNLSDYTRIGGFCTSPAGTASRQLLLRTLSGDGGNQNGFFQHPFTRTAAAGQTQLSPYSPGTQANVPAITATINSNATAAANATGAVSARVDAQRTDFNGAVASYNQSIATLNNAQTQTATDVSTLTTVANGHTATLGQYGASINGISAQYALVATLDGQSGGYTLRGVQKADGSGAGLHVRHLRQRQYPRQRHRVRHGNQRYARCRVRHGGS